MTRSREKKRDGLTTNDKPWAQPLEMGTDVGGKQDWMTFACACGFRLDRVPRQVVADLSRCLGCGKTLRATSALRTRAISDIRDLR
jgi:hypothetical protein